MFPTQRMLSREDDPAAPLFPSDFFANINSNKDEQVHALCFLSEGIKHLGLEDLKVNDVPNKR